MKQKHLEFAITYLADHNRNATRAYAKVYCLSLPKHYHSCGQSAYRLLKRADVSEFIKEREAQKAKRVEDKYEVTTDRVVSELAKLGFSTIKDFTTFEDGRITLIPSDELASSEAAAIKKVTVKPGKYGNETSIELHDKKSALDSLGKHLGIFKEKVEFSADDDLRRFFELIDGKSRQPVNIGGNKKEAIDGEVVTEELADKSEVQEVDELLQTNTKELKQELDNVNI